MRKRKKILKKAYLWKAFKWLTMPIVLKMMLPTSSTNPLSMELSKASMKEKPM